jgi:predicted MFS family arabinose efflux permease
VLLVPIQRDLHVSDAAMGALTGLSFSLVYATIALPMARLADRGNRRNVIAISMAAWSVMTAICGLAMNYAMLLLARMGVAAGEASSQPAQMSMVGDVFSFKRRGVALGFITVGTSLGVALGAYIAGVLTDLYNWHVAFMALAVPGLLIGLLIFLTVPEPARGAHDGGDRHDPDSLSWWKSLKYLARIPSMRGLLLGHIFVNLAFSGYLAWLPAYLMRVHKMTTSEMSSWYGVTIGLGAILSNITAGFLSDRMAVGGARKRLFFVAGMLLVGAPLVATVVLAHDVRLVIAMMLIYSFTTGGVTSQAIAANLDVVRPRMRGFMTASMGFCVSVIGGGFGPVILGAINDFAKLSYGAQSLRYTLVAVPIFLCCAAAAYLWASRTSDRDAGAASGAGLDGAAGEAGAPGEATR